MYYDSAVALRNGLDPYTVDLTAIANRFGLDTGSMIHTPDTPTFLLCFEPLARFPPATALWIWTSLNLVALAIAIYLMLVRRPGLDATTAWLLGGLILGFYPLDWNFVWAQTQVMILALMVTAMRAMEDEHDGTAGLIVALAGLLRAFPFLLLGYFALRQNWRALKFAFVGTTTGALITVAILGYKQCLSFFNGAAYVAARIIVFPYIVSVAPFISRMFWALFGSGPSVAGDWFLHAAIVGAVMIILTMTLGATLSGVGRRDEDYRIYSLWIVTSVLLSPIAWLHYLTLLVIPFVQIVIAAVSRRASRRALWMAAGCYLLASVSLPITFNLFAHPTVFQRAFPSLSAPLLETGFFSLFMAYVAAYWFTVDFRSGARASQPFLSRKFP